MEIVNLIPHNAFTVNVITLYYTMPSSIRIYSFYVRSNTLYMYENTGLAYYIYIYSIQTFTIQNSHINLIIRYVIRLADEHEGGYMDGIKSAFTSML